jgi:asparaginyl-tRNA synthetase
MVEPEIAFAELGDLVQLAEDFILHLVAAALAEHREDLESLGRPLAALEAIRGPFPRMTYTEAVEMLHSPELHTQLVAKTADDQEKLRGLMKKLEELERQRDATKKGWKQEQLEGEIHVLREEVRELEVDVRNQPEHLRQAREFAWGGDLGGDEETILSRQFDKPVIVTEYPREAKAFYMKLSPSDPRVVLNLDVLAPEGYGEIIGGSQREDDLEALLVRMKNENMDIGPYEWYVDLRRYGSVPHGGFGLGVERTIAWICGLRHIREAIPFPRLMGRMYP